MTAEQLALAAVIVALAEAALVIFLAIRHRRLERWLDEIVDLVTTLPSPDSASRRTSTRRLSAVENLSASGGRTDAQPMASFLPIRDFKPRYRRTGRR